MDMDISFVGGKRASYSILRLPTFLIGLMMLNAGCTQQPAPPPQMVEISASVPKLSAQKETQESQAKNGLTIALATSNYDVRLKDRIRYEEYDASVAERLMYSGDDSQYAYVNQITESSATPEPDRLKFTVSINNQMPRVFHGGGTVVQFKIGGKLLAVDQAGYSELQNAIIPPRNEQQVVIYGPPLTDIPESGVLGVFFYDVVTDQNDAGVVTKKDNYQWYFDYTMEHRSLQGTPARIKGLRMLRQQWDALKVRQETQPR